VIKLYSIIDKEFKELSTLIMNNSASMKDMYLPGEYIMTIDYKEDEFEFFVKQITANKIKFKIFKYWHSKSIGLTYYLKPNENGSAIYGLPNFVFPFFVFLPIIMMPYTIYSATLSAVILFLLLLNINNQLNQTLAKLDKLFNQAQTNTL